MGIYRKLCYIVEDLIVKFLGKNQPPDELKTKVEQYRIVIKEENLENSVL